jgi:hypothetical protein
VTGWLSWLGWSAPALAVLAFGWLAIRHETRRAAARQPDTDTPPPPPPPPMEPLPAGPGQAAPRIAAFLLRSTLDYWTADEIADRADVPPGAAAAWIEAAAALGQLDQAHRPGPPAWRLAAHRAAYPVTPGLGWPER